MPTANLTVVLANYNHARYLPRSLDAILSQSVRPRELIALDDASTKDNSLEVLDGYARRDSIVRVVRNEKNLGVVPTYNKGIGLAATEYLLLAAADDYLLPGFIEKGVAQLDAHREAGLCFTYDSYAVGDTGALVANPSGWCTSPGFFPPDEVCRLVRHCLPGHAVICRREPLVKVGGFLAELAWYSDWFAFLTVAFRHGACHVPETLAIRVLQEDSYSANARQGPRNVELLGAFFDRIASPEFADVAALLSPQRSRDVLWNRSRPRRREAAGSLGIARARVPQRLRARSVRGTVKRFGWGGAGDGRVLSRAVLATLR